MRSLFYLLILACNLIACKQDGSNQNHNEEITNEIAMNFEINEVYKELVRRSLQQPGNLNQISADTTPGYEAYDSLNDARDTLEKPVQTDTIMLSAIKHKLAKYSDPELLYAYNQILTMRADSKGITSLYGEDNRKEVDDNLDSNYKAASKSVFAIIKKNRFQNNGDRTVISSKGTYSAVYKLCNTESFRDQQVFADCTGFAISTNNVATAGHCLNSRNFKDYLVVADFKAENISSYLKNGIPQDRVFEITGIIDWGAATRDFCVFTVNKPIGQERIVKLSNSNQYTSKDNFYVIGFPCGLPMKICNSASFRQDAVTYFSINSDTYGGNSGSPVFNESTNEVEGILVRGNTDFRLNNKGCYISIQCPEYGCRGEDVTKSLLFRKFAR